MRLEVFWSQEGEYSPQGYQEVDVVSYIKSLGWNHERVNRWKNPFSIIRINPKNNQNEGESNPLHPKINSHSRFITGRTGPLQSVQSARDFWWSSILIIYLFWKFDALIVRGNHNGEPESSGSPKKFVPFDNGLPKCSSNLPCDWI